MTEKLPTTEAKPKPKEKPKAKKPPKVKPLPGPDFAGLLVDDKDKDTVVTSIPKTMKPILFRPEKYDGSWHAAKFKPQNKVAGLTVPVAISGEYRYERAILDIRKLTPKQALGVKVLTDGMASDGLQTDDGSDINSRQQAVKKLLEMLADEFVDGAVRV